jgi:hypothetical protein
MSASHALATPLIQNTSTHNPLCRNKDVSLHILAHPLLEDSIKNTFRYFKDPRRRKVKFPLLAVLDSDHKDRRFVRNIGMHRSTWCNVVEEESSTTPF